jgi:hypothetical protein
MLALEDGLALRLLTGVGEFELSQGEPLSIAQSPTRFGRIDMNLEPLDRHQGWRLKFQRGSGLTPASVLLPEILASRFRFVEIKGAQARVEGNTVFVTPSAAAWEAVWRI